MNNKFSTIALILAGLVCGFLILEWFNPTSSLTIFLSMVAVAPAGTALTGPAEESETMYELLSNEELEARYLTEEVSTNETISEEEP
jgi:hypothetical protein